MSQTRWVKPTDRKRLDSESSGHSVSDLIGTIGGGGGLPPNWEEHFDDDGTAYYVNNNTGETSWDKPSSSGAMTKAI